MTSTSLVCWKCGASLEGEPLPLTRLAECRSCHADLHICRLCEFFDTGVAKSCREPVAEEVQDKERANFCDYFQPRPDAFVMQDDSGVREARAGLDALFSGAKSSDEANTPSAEERARQQLQDLFGSDGSG